MMNLYIYLLIYDLCNDSVLSSDCISNGWMITYVSTLIVIHCTDSKLRQNDNRLLDKTWLLKLKGYEGSKHENI
jgi:hypothetical protein